MRAYLLFFLSLALVAGCPAPSEPAGDAGRDAPALDAPTRDAPGSGDALVVDAPSAMDAPSAIDAPGAEDDAPAESDAPISADAPISVDARVGVDAPGSCTPSTTDTSAIGDSCAPGGATCPAGYACHPFVGFATIFSCQILCDGRACSCPTGTTCTMHSDKTSVPWRQCDLPEGG